MGALLAISRLFLWMEQIVHILIAIIPKKRRMMQPTVLSDVKGVSPAFAVFDGIVIIDQRKIGQIPCIFIIEDSTTP